MKNLLTRAIALACMFFIVSDTVLAQKKKSLSKPSISKRTKNSGNPDADDAIRNEIKFSSNGFQVSEAYLVFDDETPVPQGNKINLNQNVNLLLIVDSGWNEIEGRVYPGSQQVVKSISGEEILITEDFFSAFDETGVAGNDARYITLNTMIPEIKDKRKPLVVSFRIWDKKGAGEIKGTYKLYVK
ncbi:MAG: hypothetical protein Q7T76_13850 [Ferruginibacter sp.]|nr:hypothetical protein [Ferruginibacter sp.]